jgi:hypothetical protein
MQGPIALPRQAGLGAAEFSRMPSRQVVQPGDTLGDRSMMNIHKSLQPESEKFTPAAALAGEGVSGVRRPVKSYPILTN